MAVLIFITVIDDERALGAFCRLHVHGSVCFFLNQSQYALLLICTIFFDANLSFVLADRRGPILLSRS